MSLTDEEVETLNDLYQRWQNAGVEIDKARKVIADESKTRSDVVQEIGDILVVAGVKEFTPEGSTMKITPSVYCSVTNIRPPDDDDEDGL